MQNKNRIMTYAYHFTSEAIIIFLSVLPVMYFHYEWVPYWTYLPIMLGIGLFFSIVTKFTASYFAYMISIPVLVGVFYLADFPFAMSILFSILLTWRYLNIRNEGIISRENSYILITIVLTTILLLWIEANEIVFYMFIQFILLFIGYICSHLAIVNKHDRKQFNHKLWFYITGFLAIATITVSLLFDIVRSIMISVWDGFTYLVVFVTSMLVRLFEDVDIEEAEVQEETMDSVEYEEESELGSSIIDGIATFILSYIGVTVLILVIVSVLNLLLYKTKFNKLNQVEVHENVSYGTLNEQTRNDKDFRNSRIKKFFKKPEHHARKMVFQFERETAKSTYGRREYETVEEWLERIGIHTDLAVYQKVRYGEIDVRDEEVEELKEQLRLINAKLSNYEDHDI